MQETWFISDTHFGHKSILQFEPIARPFQTLEEMHEVMIERWNSVVKPNDIIYHLGDFAFGSDNLKIAGRLNGRKKLVLGNHDNHPTTNYLKYFDKLYGMIFYKRCLLSHMPVHPNGLGARWFLNIHGHLHSKKVKLPESYMWNNPDYPSDAFNNDLNYFNVSCEQNNLTPINWEVIKKRLDEL